MFWHLLFAHYIGDYLLQTNWIAANKKRWSVLMLHIGIHLAVMLVVSGSARLVIWPFLLVLAAFHLSLDALKNIVADCWPDWIVLPYLVDQGLHCLSIAGIAAWIHRSTSSLTPLFDARLAIYGTGLLLTTYVWFISERVLFQRNPAYMRELIDQRWSRIMIRAIAWGSLLWLTTPTPLLAGSLAATIHWPYISGQHARRALLTDLLVVLTTLILVQLGLSGA